ncbi:ABC transporter ATP-binding protein [Dyadobacter bucti]|uniref:ABC transporter ATP-binding protein n=1 Tax=Dyadobacter bucti TaxID=2572203 RepID=UPI00286D8A60|nr:ATP-binding cassette domain-containing protein [Dyadobacter bucti]
MMVVAENISKTFNDIKAVDDISFEVKEENTMVLLGTSGCGKTTTLKMLNRLIEASSGKISINGQDIFERRPELLRRTIGYVSQSNGLFPHYTVAENIAVVPKLLKWRSEKIQKRSDELLHQLKLPAAEYGSKYPGELSGGQQQRVALARALISNPPVLLMDEPFGALDPITRTDVRREFLELPELKKKTILMVTHDVQEAFELGDQISLMDQGKIVQSGTAQELLFKPANDFVRKFLGHQKFLLELNAIKIREIWNDLPEVSVPENADLTDSQSLWEAMEQLSDNARDTVTVTDRNSGSVKTISFSLLHQGYNKLKKSR